MTLSYNEVADILKIIDASECEEVILELEGARLVVRRGGAGGASSQPLPAAPAAPAAAQPAASSSPASPAPAPQASASPAAVTADPAGAVVIRAPMVGTFYRRPSPDEPAFVEEGSVVKAGDPICLIEVMKLYTTIEASVAGRVVSVIAEDGMLVEFDQPLFTIEPA